jgi:signal transduction histidine kinase
MDDLDHVLGVLREAGDADRRPQPTLADLDRLTGDVDLVVDGDPATLAPALSREAYRIIQEGLTNAAKHGEGTVSLRLIVADELTIDVSNTLRAAPRDLKGGRGLAGIGERVRLLGGRFEAGPADGVWRLTVRLPGGQG